MKKTMRLGPGKTGSIMRAITGFLFSSRWTLPVQNGMRAILALNRRYGYFMAELTNRIPYILITAGGPTVKEFFFQNKFFREKALRKADE